jgi:hypothetical protein
MMTIAIAIFIAMNAMSLLASFQLPSEQTAAAYQRYDDGNQSLNNATAYTSYNHYSAPE